MNSVPGQIPDEITENAVRDKRRGMKLIPCGSSKKRSRLRIDIDDNLLEPEPASANRRRVASQKRDLPGNVEFPVTGAAIALAVFAGLAIGFLVGRRHDG